VEAPITPVNPEFAASYLTIDQLFGLIDRNLETAASVQVRIGFIGNAGRSSHCGYYGYSVGRRGCIRSAGVHNSRPTRHIQPITFFHNLVVSQVVYDATFGYPTSISIDVSLAIADEEVNIALSNFKLQ
jgi:hypothetical protein